MTFQEINARCTVKVQQLLRFVEAEELAGRLVGFEKFLEAEVNQSSSSVQQFWRQHNRWGYEMLGRVSRWLARHPEAELISESRDPYGFLNFKYRLPGGMEFETWGADHLTRFGRDY